MIFDTLADLVTSFFAITKRPIVPITEIEDAIMLTHWEGQILLPVIIHGPTQVVLSSAVDVSQKSEQQKRYLLAHLIQDIEFSDNIEEIQIAQWAAGDLRDQIHGYKKEVVAIKEKVFKQFKTEISDSKGEKQVFTAYLFSE